MNEQIVKMADDIIALCNDYKEGKINEITFVIKLMLNADKVKFNFRGAYIKTEQD